MSEAHNNPLVTIVTPSYNQGLFIEETICSVLSQTYPHIEYIVVDGDSTDDTHQVLDRYAGQIDRLIVEPDEGQADAINKGFRLASGALVGWLNSDDRLRRLNMPMLFAARNNPGFDDWLNRLLG